MKITKAKLKEIIMEEIVKESLDDYHFGFDPTLNQPKISSAQAAEEALWHWYEEAFMNNAMPLLLESYPEVAGYSPSNPSELLDVLSDLNRQFKENTVGRHSQEDDPMMNAPMMENKMKITKKEFRQIVLEELRECMCDSAPIVEYETEEGEIERIVNKLRQAMMHKSEQEVGPAVQALRMFIDSLEMAQSEEELDQLVQDLSGSSVPEFEASPIVESTMPLAMLKEVLKRHFSTLLK